MVDLDKIGCGHIDDSEIVSRLPDEGRTAPCVASVAEDDRTQQNASTDATDEKCFHCPSPIYVVETFRRRKASNA